MIINDALNVIEQYRQELAAAKQLDESVRIAPGDFESAYDACLTSGKFIPSQRRLEIKYLYDLIRENHCKNICEIGTLHGGTLFMLCQAAPEDAKIVSVDINSTITRRHALRKLAKPGQKLKLIVGDSHSMAVERQIKAEFRKTGIDFLFVDGDHSLFGVMNDFVRYSPLVKPGGVVAFHDIHPVSFIKIGVKTDYNVGGVPNFWEMIQKQGYHTKECIEDPSQDGYGIGIIYKESL